MRIWQFKKSGVKTYIGTIDTLTLKTELTLEPIDSPSDKAPDYEVLAGTTHVGVAFKKTSEKGNVYSSVVIDDPSFPSRYGRIC